LNKCNNSVNKIEFIKPYSPKFKKYNGRIRRKSFTDVKSEELTPGAQDFYQQRRKYMKQSKILGVDWLHDETGVTPTPTPGHEQKNKITQKAGRKAI